MKKTVVVFGTFDILHPGHLWFLGQAKKYGGHLTVVVSRDARVRQEKGIPRFNEKERLRIVAALRIVDRALLGDPPGRWAILKRLKPDIICLGHDQSADHPDIRKQLSAMAHKPKIIRMRADHPQQYRSSRLKSRL